jgi:uncharacterized protein with HEPN domain
MKSDGMKQDKVYLNHILDEIDFILTEVNNLNFDSFIELKLLEKL